MKGKHGTSAAARHAIEDRDSQLATYQRRIAALTAEVKELRDKLTDQARAHSKETRRLRVERDEGLSPTLAVIQRESASLKERLDRAERRAEDLKRRWEYSCARIIDHFDTDHRDEFPRDRDGGRNAAVSAAMRLTARPGDLLSNVQIIDDDIAVAKVTDEGKKALARARGLRGIK